LDVQYTFTLLSRFHCKIYELVEEKYQRCFLTSDEHFLYICGRRMDSPDYRITEKKLVCYFFFINHKHLIHTTLVLMKLD
jgi:hypothetical protein